MTADDHPDGYPDALKSVQIRSKPRPLPAKPCPNCGYVHDAKGCHDGY